MQVNTLRLRQHLENLGQIGRTPEGGITRSSFSAADLQARELVGEWMRDAALTVHTDAAGNLIGRREGSNPALPAIVVGSHIDTVPNGGMFDGALGVLAGIEVAHSLQEQGVALKHPLEVVAFADEEGGTLSGTFGSRAMMGLVPAKVLATPVAKTGKTWGDTLREAGRDPELVAQLDRDPHTIRAYLELHIEQGGVLERLGIPIGVVQGIVGINRYNFTVVGDANHAGTTPMDMRQDALTAAAELVLAVRDLAKAEGQMVGTVGFMEIKPGAVNVIPGEVSFTVELRSLDEDKMLRVKDALMAKAQTLLPTDVRVGSEKGAALLDQEIMELIRQACQEMGIAYHDMPSGAGHDATSMVYRGVPTAMIFVPSKGGISHAPTEWTEWEHVSLGAEILGRTVVSLDKATE